MHWLQSRSRASDFFFVIVLTNASLNTTLFLTWKLNLQYRIWRGHSQRTSKIEGRWSCENILDILKILSCLFILVGSYLAFHVMLSIVLSRQISFAFKLGTGCWDLASCQVLLTSAERFQRRRQLCLSQSEAVVTILFFPSSRKTQTWNRTLRPCFLSSFVEIHSAVSEKSKTPQPIRS